MSQDYESIALIRLPLCNDDVERNRYIRVNTRSGSAYEIDAIGECEEKILLVECKWTSKEITQKDIDDFLEESTYVKDKRKKFQSLSVERLLNQTSLTMS